MRSVLQEWVMSLPLREQGTLVVGTRGCDEAPKTPYDSTERQLTAFLRFCTMVPADDREVGVAGAFFQPFPPSQWRQSELGHYPLHWYSHIMHAFEIVAYRHPHRGLLSESGMLAEFTPNEGHGILKVSSQFNLAIQAQLIYEKLVHGLHLNIEHRETMIERLSEDRIANDTVVS